MKQTKYALPCFTFYDRAGLEDYLEKQAQKGWLLEHMGTWAWKFRRIEPQKLRFTVTYFPQADFFDPEPGEGERTFQEFCIHSGWNLAASSAQLQIFYTDREDVIPIETDPSMELENIHQSMKKSTLRGYWVMLAYSIFMVGMQIFLLYDKAIRWMSENMSLFMMVFWLVMLVVCICRLGGYYRWRKQAMAAAEEGIFLRPRSFAKLETAIGLGMLVLMFLVLWVGTDRRQGIVITMGMIPVLVGIFLVRFLVSRFQAKMKREGYDARTNRIASVVACVVLAVLVTMFVMPLVMEWTDDLIQEPKSVVPLGLDTFFEGTYQTLTIYDQESILLGYLDTHQVPEGNMMIPRLDYELVTVKADFLYEYCLTQMLNDPNWGEYRPVDATPWGADQAWQLWDDGEGEEWYLLCYDGYLLEWISSWEMTDDQKAIVGEHFS